MCKLYLNEVDKNYIDRISLSDYPILLTGNSGVGKNFISKYIHNKSKRKDMPLVEIDLSTIPLDLIEKELYGAVSGSFTGLDKDYIGKFKYANGGSVILNGIDDTPLIIQGKILQVLDKGFFYPLGSNEALRTDIRVIATTSRNLELLSENGLFRKDLYYRINTLGFKIPDLADRAEFIPKIVEDRLKVLGNDSYVRLEGYNSLLKKNWKGNIRELLNIVDRAYILKSGNEITFDSLLLSSDNTVNITSKKLKDAVNEFKKTFIADALERNSGNVTKSANELGVQRTYLSRLIKELKIGRG